MVTECELPPAQFLTEKPDKALARPGVYAILCDANGRYYVGSSKDLRIRARHHFNSLLAGTHHNPRMQHAFSKYGAKRFLFSALEETERDAQSLVECERKWIRDLDAVTSGFNVMPAANCPLGVVRENKANFKAAMKARSEDPNSKNNRKYHFVSPSGESFTGFNVARFCRDMGLTLGMKNNFQKLAKGDIGSYNGWTSPGVGPVGKRRGWPIAYSLTDPNGVVHSGSNISEFCRSIGLHAGFFQHLIKGSRVVSGWTVTPGFVFRKKSEQIEHVLFSPNGLETKFTHVKQFCETHGLNHRCVKLFLASNASQHKGWTKIKCT
jgi:group I intron endonuclease